MNDAGGIARSMTVFARISHAILSAELASGSYLPKNEAELSQFWNASILGSTAISITTGMVVMSGANGQPTPTFV